MSLWAGRSVPLPSCFIIMRHRYMGGSHAVGQNNIHGGFCSKPSLSAIKKSCGRDGGAEGPKEAFLVVQPRGH